MNKYCTLAILILTIFIRYTHLLQVPIPLESNYDLALTLFTGELDNLISKHPHSHLITSPVFGAPPAADKAQLIIIMSGDYRSKKELAYLLVPAIGKRVIDLGGNIEKGESQLYPRSKRIHG